MPIEDAGLGEEKDLQNWACLGWLEKGGRGGEAPDRVGSSARSQLIRQASMMNSDGTRAAREAPPGGPCACSGRGGKREAEGAEEDEWRLRVRDVGRVCFDCAGLKRVEARPNGRLAALEKARLFT